MLSALRIPSIFTAVDKVSAVVDRMSGNVKSSVDKINEGVKGVNFGALADKAGKISAKTGIAGAALAAPLVLAANEAIKFEDKLADIAKTTGLAGKPLTDFGNSVLNLASTTRTSIDDILTIGEIGGQLGVAQNDLISFTKAAETFSVALGKDFAGGVEDAVTSVSKIKTLFSQTKGLNIADSITRTGSAINELGAQGAGTSANITDFTLRLGALPDALKPSLTNTLALATYLEEVGINSEIGSGGLTRFLLDAGTGIGKFAKQMNMTVPAAKQLLAQDPTEFTKRFAATFNGLAPDVLATKLKKLGINSQESIKVLGALASGNERLNYLQTLSADSFSKNISLTGEAAKKNATAGASFDIMANNIKSFSIVVVTDLLPLLTAGIKKIASIVRSVTEFARENPTLTKTIIGITAAIAGLLLVISGVSGIVAAVSTAMPAILAIGGFLSAYVIPAVGLFFSLFSGAFQLMAFVLGIGTGVLAAIGAGIAFVVSIVYSLYRNWDMVVSAFKNGGLIEGLKAIGKVLLDSILFPLQKILELASGLPKFLGGGLAADAAQGIKDYRAKLGLSDGGGAAAEPVQAINPQMEQQQGIARNISERNTTSQVNVNWGTPPAGVGITQNGVPVNTTSTWGGANQ